MSEINSLIKETVTELFTMFGLEHKFKEELEEDKLKSSQEVNIVLGLTGDLKGNLLLGTNKATVLQIVSSMMGGMEFTELDDIVTSGISEFTNMVGGATATKLQNINKKADISPPTVIKSESGGIIVFNELKTHKTLYELSSGILTISCCLKE